MKILKMSSKWVLTLSLVSMSYIGITKAEGVNPYSVESKKDHQVTILSNGLSALEARLQMIERAQKSIDVEYFIYRTDTSARLFTQALVKKAKQGVKVRVLLDTFMVVKDLNPFYTHEMEKNGIEVKYFNKAGPLSIKYGQYRNHRKLLAIDGKEAITGGRNIGDEYFDLSNEYNFMDRDIYMKGEIVKSIDKTFTDFFNYEASARRARPERPNRRDYSYENPAARMNGSAAKPMSRYNYDVKKWEEKVKEAEDFIATPVADANMIRSNAKNFLASQHSGVCSKLSFESEYPIIGKETKSKRILKYGLFERIKLAKESILMESPYFIINEELGQALDSALNKKVDVTLLTNSLNSTDAIYVYANFDSHVMEWINKGFEPYIFKAERPASYPIIDSKAGSARFGIHAKTFVFDGKDIIIGTYNVDPRSANYNTEMIIACEDSQELAQVVSDSIHSRIDESFHLNSKEDVKKREFYQASFTKRIAYYLTKIPANLFSFLL